MAGYLGCSIRDTGHTLILCRSYLFLRGKGLPAEAEGVGSLVVLPLNEKGIAPVVKAKYLVVQIEGPGDKLQATSNPETPFRVHLKVSIQILVAGRSVLWRRGGDRNNGDCYWILKMLSGWSLMTA
jgi:hypothetical protein